MAKDKKKDDDKGKKSKSGKMSWKLRLFMISAILVGVVFLPTTMIIVIGMVPTLVALLLGASGRGARASTVAGMNLAGCVPFVLKLWTSGNDFEASFDIITNTQAVAIMYTAGAFGFMIDFLVTSLVSAFLYQKGVLRMKAIKKRQAFLVSHWGEEVAGKHKPVEE